MDISKLTGYMANQPQVTSIKVAIFFKKVAHILDYRLPQYSLVVIISGIDDVTY